jgi:thioredoxin-like negative regulator of GroEL
LWIEDHEELKALFADDRYQVVVDFTAPSWCRPCQQFAPHYDKAAESAKFQSDVLGRTKFVAVDVDKAPWAMVGYGVQGVPTVTLFRGGESIATLKERTAVKLLAEIRDISREG